jgi:hypothetical protein
VQFATCFLQFTQPGTYSQDVLRAAEGTVGVREEMAMVAGVAREAAKRVVVLGAETGQW